MLEVSLLCVEPLRCQQTLDNLLHSTMAAGTIPDLYLCLIFYLYAATKTEFQDTRAKGLAAVTKREITTVSMVM